MTLPHNSLLKVKVKENDVIDLEIEIQNNYKH